MALHHAGRYLKANYAVPAGIVKDRLNKLGRVARRSRPEQTISNAADVGCAPRPSSEDGARQAGRRLTVTVPIIISVEVGAAALSEPASVPAFTRRRVGVPAPPISGPAPDEVITEGHPEDYEDRAGYDADFLGEVVPLPQVKRNAADVLRFDEGGREATVLKYQHFAVVMSSSRRLCLFSAANVDGQTSRRSQRANWLSDPRIPAEGQILKECYGNPPKFSRGHMTRREDPVWGSAEEAELGNRDSMHVTNTVPQLQTFNAGVWLALENYALQNARKDQMKISVFTGPILRLDDPEEYGVKIPIRFWKVIAFIHDETRKLCATGYTMSQQADLDDREFVFGQHETSQLSISSIESETGLSFGRLPDVDPLEGGDEGLVLPLTNTNQIRFF